MKYDSPASAYKPVHGGYPSNGLDDSRNPNPVAAIGANPNEYSPADDDGRTVHTPIELPSNPDAPQEEPAGYGWQGPLPEIYFEAVRVVEVLRRNAHEASKRHWALETAIRGMRLAEGADARAKRVSDLIYAVAKARDEGGKDLAVQLRVEQLINTIEVVPNNAKPAVQVFGGAARRVSDLIRNTDG